MSILDLGYHSTEAFQEAALVAAQVIDEALNGLGVSDDENVKFLRAGYLPKDICGLTDGDLEALFQIGCQDLRLGQLEKARAMFGKLCQLDCLDARFPYALGAVLQLSGLFDAAAKAYLVALALDAMRPDVYLRLVECLVAVGEYAEAREMAFTAIAVARGDGSVDVQCAALLARIDRLEEVAAPEMARGPGR